MTARILLLVLLAAQTAARQETGRLSGQVRNADGALMAGVRVAVIALEGDAAILPIDAAWTNISETDRNGRFQLQGVAPGRYLIVGASLYAPTYYPGVRNPADGRIVSVVAGQEIDGLNFDLAGAPATVRQSLPIAKVTTDDGSEPPPVNFQIRATAIDRNVGGANIDFRLLDFTLRVIPPGFSLSSALLNNDPVPALAGDYTVSVTALPIGYVVKSMEFGNADLTRTPLRFPADPYTPIFIVLTRAAGVTVSGRIVGNGPRTGQVRMMATSSPTPRHEGAADIDADGRFEFRNVTPGQYRIGFGGTIPLKVGDRDITNLELVSGIRFDTSTTTVLNGIVEGEGTLPAFQIGFIPDRGGETLSFSVSGREFSLPIPEGEYRVSISGLPEATVVESVTAGPLDLTSTFMVRQGGIADRFTGKPALGPPVGTAPTGHAGIKIRLRTTR